jgi:serpin B
MLAEGLEEPVRSDLISKFGLDPKDVYKPARLEAIRKNLNQSSDKDWMKFNLATSNSIWAKNGLSLNPTFKQTVIQKYNGIAKEVDFTDSKTVDVVNNWVSENTGGMINDFIKSFPASTLLVLMNTVYFSAQFSQPFEKYNTQEAEFTNEVG